jgi:hypothetical protein
MKELKERLAKRLRQIDFKNWNAEEVAEKILDMFEPELNENLKAEIKELYERTDILKIENDTLRNEIEKERLAKEEAEAIIKSTINMCDVPYATNNLSAKINKIRDILEGKIK